MIEHGNTYTIKTADGAKAKARVIQIKPQGRGYTVTYKANGTEQSMSLRSFEKALAA